MKAINVSEETKATFDTVQIEMTSLKGKILSQDETVAELIKIYNEQKLEAQA